MKKPKLTITYDDGTKDIYNSLTEGMLYTFFDDLYIPKDISKGQVKRMHLKNYDFSKITSAGDDIYIDIFILSKYTASEVILENCKFSSSVTIRDCNNVRVINPCFERKDSTLTIRFGKNVDIKIGEKGEKVTVKLLHNEKVTLTSSKILKKLDQFLCYGKLHLKNINPNVIIEYYKHDSCIPILIIENSIISSNIPKASNLRLVNSTVENSELSVIERLTLTEESKIKSDSNISLPCLSSLEIDDTSSLSARDFIKLYTRTYYKDKEEIVITKDTYTSSLSIARQKLLFVLKDIISRTNGVRDESLNQVMEIMTIQEDIANSLTQKEINFWKKYYQEELERKISEITKKEQQYSTKRENDTLRTLNQKEKKLLKTPVKDILK